MIVYLFSQKFIWCKISFFNEKNQECRLRRQNVLEIYCKVSENFKKSENSQRFKKIATILLNSTHQDLPVH